MFFFHWILQRINRFTDASSLKQFNTNMIIVRASILILRQWKSYIFIVHFKLINDLLKTETYK